MIFTNLDSSERNDESSGVIYDLGNHDVQQEPQQLDELDEDQPLPLSALDLTISNHKNDPSMQKIINEMNQTWPQF